ncbi:hypothetical protein L1887_59520 [Cichorium endivia]|nr:hypothetical protein L1887_59520 [Cichorium endivia]
MPPTLLITGASRGIGRATALLAGSRGWSIGVNYLSNGSLAAETVSAIQSSGACRRAARRHGRRSGRAARLRRHGIRLRAPGRRRRERGRHGADNDARGDERGAAEEGLRHERAGRVPLRTRSGAAAAFGFSRRRGQEHRVRVVRGRAAGLAERVRRLRGVERRGGHADGRAEQGVGPEEGPGQRGAAWNHSDRYPCCVWRCGEGGAAGGSGAVGARGGGGRGRGGDCVVGVAGGELCDGNRARCGRRWRLADLLPVLGRLPGLALVVVEVVDLLKGHVLGLIDEEPDEDDGNPGKAAPDPEDVGLRRVKSAEGYRKTYHRQTLRANLEREQLSRDNPCGRSETRSKERDVNAQEDELSHGRGVVLSSVGSSAGSSNDKLTSSHSKSTDEQYRAATKAVNGVETRQGHEDVDQVDDNLENEGVWELLNVVGEVGSTVVDLEGFVRRCIGQDEQTASEDQSPRELDSERDAVGTAVGTVACRVGHDSGEEETDGDAELVAANNSTSDPLGEGFRLGKREERGLVRGGDDQGKHRTHLGLYVITSGPDFCYGLAKIHSRVGTGFRDKQRPRQAGDAVELRCSCRGAGIGLHSAMGAPHLCLQRATPARDRWSTLLSACLSRVGQRRAFAARFGFLRLGSDEGLPALPLAMIQAFQLLERAPLTRETAMPSWLTCAVRMSKEAELRYALGGANRAARHATGDGRTPLPAGLATWPSHRWQDPAARGTGASVGRDVGRFCSLQQKLEPREDWQRLGLRTARLSRSARPTPASAATRSPRPSTSIWRRIVGNADVHSALLWAAQRANTMGTAN